MKLFYSPGACSLCPHIVASELGIAVELARVDLGTKTIATEGDYWAINPKGYVPAIELDGGGVLTEVAAVVQYLADLRPAAKLAPACGTPERYRMQEMLGYISTEIHKGFSPLFRNSPDPVFRENLTKRLAFVAGVLEDRAD